MSAPDFPVQVPVDDPNADTEWNDILRAHKIIPPKPPSPTKELEESVLAAIEEAHVHRLDHATLDDLNELEDLEDPEFLETYRRQRMGELSALAKKEIHGAVYPVQKSEYEKNVTEASRGFPVLVLLWGTGVESRLLQRYWRELAARWMDVKFCEIKGDMCIEGYPDKNCPTVLVYLKGELVTQIVGLWEMRGKETTVRDVEEWIVKVGAVEKGDMRLRRGEEEKENADRGLRVSEKKKDDDDDDSDWD